MSPPWMPFYIADYLADTRHLGALEHGAYILLIMEYWRKETLPNDDRQLARIACVTEREWQTIRPTVAAFFKPNWSGHKRIDVEMALANKRYRRVCEYRRHCDARRPLPLAWIEMRTRVFARDNFTCQYCGSRGGELECDHIIPIARGGTSDDSNLVTSCRPCNRDKGSQILEVWRARV